MEHITIVPFTIHEPGKISNYVDASATMFTTIYDKWNIEKADRLRRHGFDVFVLWTRENKEYEGSRVRTALRRNEIAVSEMVSAGVLDVINDLKKRRPELEALLKPVT